jgi:hypothetical protein
MTTSTGQVLAYSAEGRGKTILAIHGALAEADTLLRQNAALGAYCDTSIVPGRRI